MCIVVPLQMNVEYLDHVVKTHLIMTSCYLDFNNEIGGCLAIG